MLRILPDKLYAFREAAALLPSDRYRCGIAPETLHRWRREGRFQAVSTSYGATGKRKVWFVWGRELLKLVEGLRPCS